MASHALTIAAVLLAGFTASEAPVGSSPQPGGVAPGAQAWTEVRWPFPFDPWGPGRAFRCAAASCGSELLVYVRPKIGFCNCSTGVADDDEIDRVGDVVLLGENYRPLRPGAPAQIGTMPGRARAFAVKNGSAERYALGIAVSKKCDALVATVVSDRPLSPAHESAARGLLDGGTVAPWAEASVGL